MCYLCCVCLDVYIVYIVAKKSLRCTHSGVTLNAVKGSTILRQPLKGTHPYHHGSLRKAAIRAGQRILLRKGADALTVRAIARDVGVTPNALYRHFKDKKALLATLAAEGFRELTAAFQAIQPKDPRKRFLGMATAYVQFGSRRTALLELMFEQKITTVARDDSLERAAKDAFMALLEGAAAAAGLSAQSKDSMLLAIACWSLVHGYTILLTKGALDFAGTSHNIETLARFIELDPGRSRTSEGLD